MMRGRRLLGDKEERKLTLNSRNEEKRECGILLNSVTGDLDKIKHSEIGNQKSSRKTIWSSMKMVNNGISKISKIEKSTLTCKNLCEHIRIERYR